MADARCDALKDVLKDLSTQLSARLDVWVWGALGGSAVVVYGLAKLRHWAVLRQGRESIVPSGPVCALIFVLFAAFPLFVVQQRIRGSAAQALGAEVDKCRSGLDEPCPSQCNTLDEVVKREGRLSTRASLIFGLVYVGIFFLSWLALTCMSSLRLAAVPVETRSLVDSPPPVAGLKFTLKVVPEDDHSHEDDEHDDSSCAICLTELWERTVVQLDCKHRFHRSCAKKWLKRAPSPSCPLCKAPVEPATTGPALDMVVVES